MSEYIIPKSDEKFIKNQLVAIGGKWCYYVTVYQNFTEYGPQGVRMSSCRKFVGAKFEERVKQEIAEFRRKTDRRARNAGARKAGKLFKKIKN